MNTLLSLISAYGIYFLILLALCALWYYAWAAGYRAGYRAGYQRAHQFVRLKKTERYGPN